MQELSFTPGDAMFVAHTSVIKTTNSGESADPSATLDMYNVNTGQQLQGITSRIRNNTQFGLPHFKRSIDPNALKDIATDTVLQDLADIVFFQSFPTSQPTAAAAGVSRTGARMSRAGAGGLMGRVTEFTQEKPMSSLLMATAGGTLLGFMIARCIRR
ncbi:MAG: hypothetical protein WCD76_07370 [Pyrinomonadaceae bacterium]